MLASCAAAAGIFLFSSTQPPPALETHGPITVLSPPLALPAFSLEASGQASLTRDSLRGRWTFVALGFTACPDICPTTLGLLSDALAQLDDASGDTRVLFVSVDPERDTPVLLESYVRHFGDSVIGATGSHERLLALTQPLGLFYQRDDSSADEENYSVAHSTTVLLVGPDAEVVALLRSSELEPAEIAAAVDEFRRGV